MAGWWSLQILQYLAMKRKHTIKHKKQNINSTHWYTHHSTNLFFLSLSLLLSLSLFLSLSFSLSPSTLSTLCRCICHNEDAPDIPQGEYSGLKMQKIFQPTYTSILWSFFAESLLADDNLIHEKAYQIKIKHNSYSKAKILCLWQRSLHQSDNTNKQTNTGFASVTYQYSSFPSSSDSLNARKQSLTSMGVLSTVFKSSMLSWSMGCTQRWKEIKREREHDGWLSEQKRRRTHFTNSSTKPAHLFQCGLILEMQEGLVPVDGKVVSIVSKWLIVALDRTPATESGMNSKKERGKKESKK